MTCNQESVKLVITHDDNPPPNKKEDVKTKSSRCKDTIDWVEVEYGDAYKKLKKGEVGY